MAASVEEGIGAVVALDALSDVASSIELPLVIGVTTRTMFDLAEEHAVFVREGVGAYAKLQRARENDPLKPGAAFEVTRRLLALNPPGGIPIVEVILLSKNSPDLSLRAFRAFEHRNARPACTAAGLGGTASLTKFVGFDFLAILGLHPVARNIKTRLCYR